MAIAWTLLVVGCGDGSEPADAGPVTACETDEDCDDGAYCTGVERCAPDDPSARANGCAPSETRPCVEPEQTCDESAGECVTNCEVTRDFDGDGYVSALCEGGTDCDDTDGRVHPNALEICDSVGRDEDCDPTTFGSERDADGDGFADANCINVDNAGEVTSRGPDCDDRRGFVAPDQPEVCNGLDDDCDGSFDEGVSVERFVDADGDGDGDPMVASEMVCPDATGYAPRADDCDDTTALFRSPDWFELCDGEDNDCDGRVDESPVAVAWYEDADGDGFGTVDQPVVVSCAPVSGRSLLGTDCDDTRAGVHPGSPELCNGIDDDCNGRLDFRDLVEGYAEDEDGDGVPNGRCSPNGDCDDTDFLTGDAPEICDDLVDNDCDGMVDEADPTIAWYPDLDGDGWGDEVSGVASTECAFLPLASTRVHDCDDTNPARHPQAVDICNDFDDDCDGERDEDAAFRIIFEDVDNDGFGDEASPQRWCGPLPSGFSDVPRDCAPMDPGIALRWADGDGDGVGGGEPLRMCTGLEATRGGDCDDGNPLISSGCVELCNGMDDDADGMIDENGAMGCPNAATTMWTCAAGICVPGGCTVTGADCDTNPLNGCEVDVTSSPDHCGGCGTTCGAGGTCSMMSCGGQVIDVSLGTTRSCVLRNNGRVACWGNLPGGLPLTGAEQPSTLTLLREGTATITDATWLSVGPTAWCVGRASDTTMRCASRSNPMFGVGGHGVTGDQTMSASMATGVSAASSSEYHGCGLGPGGTVICWGRDSNGQLGRDNQMDNVPFPPAAAIGITGATAVDVGRFHSCAVAGGQVHCWGQGMLGRLGTPATSNLTRPALVPITNPSDAPVDVACSNNATCVLRMSGLIECTGFVQFGGTAGSFSATSLTTVGTVPGAEFIAAGGDHFCVGSVAAGAWCFGSDATGALGTGVGRADGMTPTRVVGLTSGVVAIDASRSHTCAVTNVDRGQVWCWGLMTSGQLGTRTGDLEVPGRVLSLP